MVSPELPRALILLPKPSPIFSGQVGVNPIIVCGMRVAAVDRSKVSLQPFPRRLRLVFGQFGAGFWTVVDEELQDAFLYGLSTLGRHPAAALIDLIGDLKSHGLHTDSPLFLR